MALDFRVGDFFYPLRLMRLRRLFAKTPFWTAEEIRRYQEKKLAPIIRQAFDNVPVYRRLFALAGIIPEDIRTIDDLKKLPRTRKEDLRNKGGEFLADNAGRYDPRIYATSGTAGAPTKLWLDREARALEFVYYWRHWKWAGYKLGNRFAELGSYFFISANRSDLLTVEQPYLGRLMINSARIGPGTAKNLEAVLIKWQAEYIKGTASALYYFARSFRETGVDNIHFRAAFSTGEVLTPFFRKEIETVFGCRVLDSYGHMEGTVAISECPEGGYHINDDYGILELVDKRKDEEGRIFAGIVGTSLYNMAMPLLRYEVGDEVELFTEDKGCPCGRQFPLVKAIHGRGEDVIQTPAGYYVTSLYVLPEMVVGPRFIQFIQDKIDEIRVLIVPGPGWTDEEKSKLVSMLANMVGEGVSIRIQEVFREELETGPSGKFRTVISRIGVNERP